VVARPRACATPQRLPVVLTVNEIRRVIDAVEEPSRLIVKLLYGSGLRLLEALTLRVKDVDFARGQLTVGQRRAE
jgi:integrase